MDNRMARSCYRCLPCPQHSDQNHGSSPYIVCSSVSRAYREQCTVFVESRRLRIKCKLRNARPPRYSLHGLCACTLRYISVIEQKSFVPTMFILRNGSPAGGLSDERLKLARGQLLGRPIHFAVRPRKRGAISQ
jgi:hypothetical protein